ncbi:uncharacterized protein HLK63_J03091 [Nakaseomyces glabratus]|nr:uncharacterized protein GW608_J03091 [Nakaseomyces glabratus]UCS26875.1 uncharacterized protein HLK63_J03091 [Nakaseomyces glabratus]UCS32104.1 uncharacterized protein HLK64_J03091 [Nakaseomyces glabratus]UCS37333.1 uncharacterized protein HLK62_J03091 [Nakaseomyces glabratus]
MIFGLGRLFYVTLLLINAVAVLSEERFLSRIGLGRSGSEAPAFGQNANSTKSKVVQLIGAVQTLLRNRTMQELITLSSSYWYKHTSYCLRAIIGLNHSYLRY